jgi:hypothetical protein
MMINYLSTETTLPLPASLCLVGLGRTTRKFSQESRCPCRNSKKEPSEYKSEALLSTEHLQYAKYHIVCNAVYDFCSTVC